MHGALDDSWLKELGEGSLLGVRRWGVVELAVCPAWPGLALSPVQGVLVGPAFPCLCLSGWGPGLPGHCLVLAGQPLLSSPLLCTCGRACFLAPSQEMCHDT